MDKVTLEALRARYFEQLPTITAMLVPEEEYDPEDVAREAIELIDAILSVLDNEE